LTVWMRSSRTEGDIRRDDCSFTEALGDNRSAPVELEMGTNLLSAFLHGSWTAMSRQKRHNFLINHAMRFADSNAVD
jgi:hypothetical protein